MKMKGPPQRLTDGLRNSPLCQIERLLCCVFFPLELELPTRGRRGRAHWLKRDLLGASGEGEARSRLLLILGEIP